MSVPASKVKADANGKVASPEAASAKNMLGRIERAKKDNDDRFKDFDRLRKYVKGEIHNDGQSGLVRTNLMYTNISTIVPHVYSKDPELSISPSKAVQPAQYQVVRKFSETLECVLKRMFLIEGKLKSRCRSNLYSVQVTGEGWLKMVYTRDWQTDPIHQKNLEDTQAQLDEIKQKVAKLKDVDQMRELDAQRYDLMELLKQVESQVEYVASEGLVIDRLRTEDMLILDATLFDFAQYEQAAELAQRTWMTVDEYEQMFDAIPDIGGPTLFSKPFQKDDNQNIQNIRSMTADGTGNNIRYVAVWEIWNRRERLVKTIAEGASGYAREAFCPQKLPARFYPFYRLGWNFLDADINCVSDAAMQTELQDEYNTNRTQYAEHRKDSMPVRIVRGGGALKQEDIDNIQARKSRQIIVVEGDPAQPLKNDIAELPNVPLDPQVYDTSTIRADMELVAGRGDAAAGVVQQAKTATEASIMQAGLMSRSEYRRDITEDFISDMAIAAAQMLLGELTLEQVQQIAGPNAVWPRLSSDEIMHLIQVEIRGGSTAKPNKAEDIEHWQVLMPLLQTSIQQIFQLRMQGQNELAHAVRWMMEETLRRFDERIDLEDVLGPDDQQSDGAQQQLAQMQQQNTQLQQHLQDAMQKLQGIDQAKMAKVQTDAQLAQQKMQQEAELHQADVALKQRQLDMADAEARRAEDAHMAQQVADDHARSLAEHDQAVQHGREMEKLQAQQDGAAQEHGQQLEIQNYEATIAQLQNHVGELEQQLKEQQAAGEDTSSTEQAQASNDKVIEVLTGMLNELKAQEASRGERQQAVLDYLNKQNEPGPAPAANSNT